MTLMRLGLQWDRRKIRPDPYRSATWLPRMM